MIDFGFICYDPYCYERLTYQIYEIFCCNVLKTLNLNIWLCNKRIGNIISLILYRMEVVWTYAMERLDKYLTLGFDFMI